MTLVFQVTNLVFVWQRYLFGISCLLQQWFLVDGFASTLNLAGSASLRLVLVIGIYVGFVLNKRSFGSCP